MFSARCYQLKLLIVLFAGMMPLSVYASGAASWFEAPYKGIAPLKRTGDLLSSNQNTLRLDVQPSALASSADVIDAGAESYPDHVLHVYSGYESSPEVSLVYPLRSPDSQDAASRRLSNIAVSWERRFDSLNRLSLSAGYADFVPGRQAAANEFADAHAGVAWTHALSGKWRPSLTGSVFVGD